MKANNERQKVLILLMNDVGGKVCLSVCLFVSSVSVFLYLLVGDF